MTYNEAYNKIIDAYFKDEIKPFDAHFCFCGTLCDNTDNWYRAFNIGSHNPSHGYSGLELSNMEIALLRGLSYPLVTEDEIFAGMSAALDVLKQIHLDWGEVIDQTPVFTKRQLA